MGVEHACLKAVSAANGRDNLLIFRDSLFLGQCGKSSPTKAKRPYCRSTQRSGSSGLEKASARQLGGRAIKTQHFSSSFMQKETRDLGGELLRSRHLASLSPPIPHGRIQLHARGMCDGIPTQFQESAEFCCHQFVILCHRLSRENIGQCMTKRDYNGVSAG